MSSIPRFLRLIAACTTLTALLFMSGCVSLYVDSGLKDVSATEIKKPARPQEVQLLFGFETKGSANARATELLKSEVVEVVGSSGIFSTVATDPVASGAILNVIINNVPVTDENDAMVKGFATGLTFGLAGSTVTDGYICTVDYLPPAGGPKITRTSRHAVYSTIGAKGAPPNTIKAKNAEDAFRTMTRQIIIAALKDLSQDPVWK